MTTLPKYSETINSLLRHKLSERRLTLKDLTWFEYRGFVHFYYGATLVLSAEFGPPEIPSKLIYRRVFVDPLKPNKVYDHAPKPPKKKTKSSNVKVENMKPRRILVYERDGYRCLKCGESDVEKLTLDHIIPKSMGGKNSIKNLQTLCSKCNSEKSNKSTADYRKIKLTNPLP